jgi:hypothetical protein
MAMGTFLRKQVPMGIRLFFALLLARLRRREKAQEYNQRRKEMNEVFHGILHLTCKKAKSLPDLCQPEDNLESRADSEDCENFREAICILNIPPKCNLQ